MSGDEEAACNVLDKPKIEVANGLAISLPNLINVDNHHAVSDCKKAEVVESLADAQTQLAKLIGQIHDLVLVNKQLSMKP